MANTAHHTNRNSHQFGSTIHPDDIHLSTQQQESSWKVFNFYDLDKNGEISKDELKHVLENFRTSINEMELNAFFEQYDIDASNYIDFNEFLEIIKYKLAQDANSLAGSKSISFFFEKEELEILIQYLDVVPFKQGEALPFQNKNAEEIVLTLGNETASDMEDASLPMYTATKNTNQKAESSGIAIRMEEEKLGKLV